MFASNLREKQNKIKQKKKKREKKLLNDLAYARRKQINNNKNYNGKNRNIADSLLCLVLGASTTTVIREVVSWKNPTATPYRERLHIR